MRNGWPGSVLPRSDPSVDAVRKVSQHQLLVAARFANPLQSLIEQGLQALVPLRDRDCQPVTEELRLVVGAPPQLEAFARHCSDVPVAETDAIPEKEVDLAVEQ